ncbi:hypothetical protein [Chryseolinea sp. H1M3-3]|uniref:hypothetical protein n=1 Tax=Chryseolinea sp. H1M3-3 TaxID=3034144 RepID=UPI0023EC8A2B|nr:hypothetical protein [Chryseolinea sp. H1M3-3]
MNESKDNKHDNKYLEVALILCNFIIPFVGLQYAFKKYLGGSDLSFSSTFLLVFIAGNIMTWMIFLLDGKALKIKLMWGALLIIAMVLVNFFVR